MFFPENITFQYLFFSTYIGYFLQLIPVALIAGLLYWHRRRKRNPEERTVHAFLATLFVSYLVALITITLFETLLENLYYWLFYHSPSGNSCHWFEWVYSFRLDFFRNLTAENLFNILLFLPYGILYPFFHARAGFLCTVGMGILTSAAIELIQPLMGRSFDINDLVLNGIGTVVSAALFCLLRNTIQRRTS